LKHNAIVIHFILAGYPRELKVKLGWMANGLSCKLRPKMKSFYFYWTLQTAREIGNRKWKV